MSSVTELFGGAGVMVAETNLAKTLKAFFEGFRRRLAQVVFRVATPKHAKRVLKVPQPIPQGLFEALFLQCSGTGSDFRTFGYPDAISAGHNHDHRLVSTTCNHQN